jgi:hypothetical protein
LGGSAAAWVGVGSAGEFVEVFLLVVVEAQGAGQGGENGCGGPDTALFQSRVVVHADGGELGDLLAAQSGDPAGGVRLGKAALLWCQLGAAGLEEGAERPGVGV